MANDDRPLRAVTSARNRVEVLHGVNLDMLGKRDQEHYGTLTLVELEVRIRHWARQLGLETSFFHTNSEGEFVERLHQVAELADALLLNPGAWTHYSYAIRDALEIAAKPAVEVHLSNVDEREEWRRHSVLGDLVLDRVAGEGADGYRRALELIARELEVDPLPAA
jgi:3-dehydroquinate dehydratase-2